MSVSWFCLMVITLNININIKQVVSQDDDFPLLLQQHMMENFFPKLARAITTAPLSTEQHLRVLDRFSQGENPFEYGEKKGNSTPASPKCVKDLIYIMNPLTHGGKKPWLVPWIDSLGKIEPGVIKGNLHWNGDYWECLSVNAPVEKVNGQVHGGFNGRYCSATLDLMMNSNATGGFPLAITYGICVPDSCRQEDIMAEINRLRKFFIHLPPMNRLSKAISIQSVSCPEHRPMTIDGILCLAVVSFFVVLSFFATIVDIYRQNTEQKLNIQETSDNQIPEPTEKEDDLNSDNGNNEDEVIAVEDTINLVVDKPTHSTPQGAFWLKLLLCFSLYSNWKKLTNISSSKYELGILHGIRFLSMVWIICGHTYAFSLQILSNILDAFESIDNLPFYTILNGSLSVDSFFVLSGFLVSYLFFLKKQKFNIFYFYLHRYWRLVPLYAMVIWVYSSLMDKFSSGPFWDYGVNENSPQRNCRDKFWYNLLFINNFLDLRDECLSYTWYLPNDFQFYLLSPIFLLTISWNRYLGYLLTGVALIGSWITTFTISYTHQSMLSFGSGTPPDSLIKGNATELMNHAMEYMNLIYQKPYCRIGPYLIGIIAGHLLVEHMKHKFPVKKSRAVFGLFLSMFLCITSLYISYHRKMTLFELSVHQATFRITWAIGLCLLILICAVGNGGIISEILSYPLWVPLSRVTFAAYLLHPIVLISYFDDLKTPLQFSQPVMLCIFGAALLHVYLLSFCCSLLFEAPFLNIEKLVLKRTS